MTSLGSFASVIGRGVYIVGMTYVGPEETDEYGTCDDFAMLCSDGSVYLFSMAYYKNANGRKTYGLYSSSLLGNVPDVMANYAAGSALYYADNRLYISVLTTSASKLSYVDLTADIFWPISIGRSARRPSPCTPQCRMRLRTTQPWRLPRGRSARPVCRLWSPPQRRR